MAPHSQPLLLHRVSGGLRVPRLAKAGAATILFGLLADVAAHTLAPQLHDAVVGGFSVGEHAAHLLALVGMVLVLAGIVADGIRVTGRHDRPEGRHSHAVR